MQHIYIILKYYTFMQRKTTSIKVEEELWKEVKKHCIDLNKDISEYIEDLIKKDIKKSK